MGRRHIFVFLLVCLTLCFWFVLHGGNSAGETDIASPDIENPKQAHRVPVLQNDDLLTRDAHPVELKYLPEDTQGVTTLEDPKIVGYVFNKLSGQRYRAWVDLYQDNVGTQSTDCFVDAPFEFEVERGHVYQLFVRKITDGDGFRPAEQRWIPAEGEDFFSENTLRIPADSEQMVWQEDIEIYKQGSVRGRILAPDGEPILGADFQFVRVEELDSPYAHGKIKVGALGVFQTSFGASKTVVLRFDFSQALQQEHKNLIPPVTSEIQLLEGQILDLGDFIASKGTAKVFGKVVDQYGEAFAGLVVNCFQSNRTRFANVGSMVTDENGVFEFATLIEGAYEIDLANRSYRQPLLADMKFAWNVPAIPFEVEGSQQESDLGNFVVPRPIRFRQKIEIEGGVQDSYFIQIETVPNEDITNAVEGLAKQYPQTGQLKGWAPPPLMAHFDWLEAPPWFNHNPEVTVLYAQAAIREIACRLPHAPIRIRVFESIDGVVGKESEVVVYPSPSAEPVVVVPAPK